MAIACSRGLRTRRLPYYTPIELQVEDPRPATELSLAPVDEAEEELEEFLLSAEPLESLCDILITKLDTRRVDCLLYVLPRNWRLTNRSQSEGWIIPQHKARASFCYCNVPMVTEPAPPN